jgi:hypothetical protein
MTNRAATSTGLHFLAPCGMGFFQSYSHFLITNFGHDIQRASQAMMLITASLNVFCHFYLPTLSVVSLFWQGKRFRAYLIGSLAWTTYICAANW